MKGSTAWPSVDGSPLYQEGRERCDPNDVLAPFLPTPPRLAQPSQRRDTTETGGVHCYAAPAPASLTLTVASYNSLSLAAVPASQNDALNSEGLAFGVARPALLARSLEEASVEVACIQETRCAQGTLHTGAYYRVCSGSMSGSYGTEWWFKTDAAIMCRGNVQVRLTPAHILVHHTSPRRLILSLTHGSARIFFVGLHAPHRGTEPHVVAQWWTETLQLCRDHVGQHECVIAGDMNASVGTVVSDNVSSFGEEVEDTAGTFLHQLLQEREAWLPSTYEQHHSGQHWTYTQKRNGRNTRPDFVAIPHRWRTGEVLSRVMPQIHAGQLAPDHCAVVVTTRAALACANAQPDMATAPRRRYDEHAISLPANREVVRQIIATMPDVDWHTSAHEHAAIAVRHLQEQLEQAFPLQGQRKAKKHSFLTDATWHLHAYVARLRRACANCRRQLDRHVLAAAFRTWRALHAAVAFADFCFTPWKTQAHRGHAYYCQQLYKATLELRAACNRDRARHLEDCAARANAGQDREAYQAVRRLLGHKRKRPFAPDVLPSLLQADGTECATPEEVSARWKQHFGDLEAGVVAPPGRIFGECRAPAARSWPLPCSVESLPGEASLVGAIASAQLHKAPGPDGIPAAMGRCFPGLLASKLMPLLLKLCLLGEEAAGMKGGCLIHLYKGRGPHNKCGSHRGILLLSTIAKYLHKALRPAISSHFQQHALPLQLGGRIGTPVAFAAHIVRAFLRWQAQQGLSCGVLFADISAAFYAAVRQLAAPVELRSFADVSTGLALEPGDVEALRAHLSEPNALVADGASEWLQHIAAEIHTATWMQVAGTEPTPLLTRRGTRPGSNWADLTFAVILKAVLACRDKMRSCVYTPQVPWNGSKSVFAPSEGGRLVELGEVIWADDLAACFSFPTANAVGPGLMHESGIMSDSFQSYAMRLNYGPTKTAAIAACRGPGARDASLRLFGQQHISVLREHSAPESVPLVARYRHVGVVHGPEGSIKDELRQRVAEAWVAYRQGRKKIYRNGQLTTDAKITLWRTMVLSRLFYAAGSWPELPVAEKRLLQSAILCMLRQITVPCQSEEQRIHQCEVCAAAVVACPAALLHAERLRYLKQMVIAGPPALWALVKLDPSSCLPFQEALLWLHNRDPAMRALDHPAQHWEAWESFIRDEPRAYGASIKRALRLDASKQKCLAALCPLHRMLQDMQGRDLCSPLNPGLHGRAMLPNSMGIGSTAPGSPRVGHAWRVARPTRTSADSAGTCRQCLTAGPAGAVFGRPRRKQSCMCNALPLLAGEPRLRTACFPRLRFLRN